MHPAHRQGELLDWDLIARIADGLDYPGDIDLPLIVFDEGLLGGQVGAGRNYPSELFQMLFEVIDAGGAMHPADGDLGFFHVYSLVLTGFLARSRSILILYSTSRVWAYNFSESSPAASR